MCGADVAVTKEYNIRRHYETKHHAKNKDMDIKQKLQKVEEMKRSTFTKAISRSETTFIVAAEISKSNF